MYRSTLLLLLFTFFVSNADSNLPLGYHLKVGIPKALEVLKNESIVSRIVGGSQVGTADSIPHQAGLVIRLTTGWTSICGGALVSSTRVLTAAHCWWDGTNQANLFTVVLGSLTIFTGGTRIETTDVSTHPSWNPSTLLNDIAVVRITQVTFSNNIQVLPLPTMANVNLDFAGQTGTVAGYGKTSDAQNSFPTTTALHQVSVQIITNTVCQSSFSMNIHGSHLCTSGQGTVGTCEGDSGGPLTVVLNNQRTLLYPTGWGRLSVYPDLAITDIYTERLPSALRDPTGTIGNQWVGIVSFGPNDGCQAGLPSVYTRVTAFLSWVQSVL